MTVASGADRAVPACRHARTRGALMFGNFVIGCGIMIVPGTLNDLAHSLQVSVALTGQLFAIGAATVCFGAPLLAGWVAAFDRRKLLTVSLIAYAVGHALCAAMPSFLTGAGQFTLFSYFTPYFRDVLHASTVQASLLLVWFGVFGLLGNLVLTRLIDRVGTHVAGTAMVCFIAVTFLAWPFVAGVIATVVALVPWAFGCFSGQSAQQARLSAVAPTPRQP